MTPPSARSDYGEDAVVEQPTIELFSELGWEVADLYQEWASGISTEGRESEKQVVLKARLRTALERLNPSLPGNAIDQVIEEVTRDRSRMVPVNANEELWRLLRDGAKIKVSGERGQQTTQTVQIVDWRNPEANDFLLVSQFWVTGEMYKRRRRPRGVRQRHPARASSS